MLLVAACNMTNQIRTTKTTTKKEEAKIKFKLMNERSK